MADNLNPESGRERARAPEPTQPVSGETTAERQVALHGQARPAVAVQQWLDGELSESLARRASTTEVDLWRRIGEETSRRGRMTTPAPVLDRIMASIPEKAPAAPQPWWKSPAPFSTAAALTGGAALLVLGTLLGALLN